MFSGGIEKISDKKWAKKTYISSITGIYLKASSSTTFTAFSDKFLNRNSYHTIIMNTSNIKTSQSFSSPTKNAHRRPWTSLEPICFRCNIFILPKRITKPNDLRIFSRIKGN